MAFWPHHPEGIFSRLLDKELSSHPGEPSRFAHLFAWEVLSKALEEHKFDEKRLKLFRSGATIEMGRYLSGRMVNSAGLLDELAAGAILIFNQCEDMHQASAPSLRTHGIVVSLQGYYESVRWLASPFTGTLRTS